MSSTKRNKRPGNPDYYRTPEWAIHDFLEAFLLDESCEVNPTQAFGTSVLDPCAGGDANHPMPYPKVLVESGIPEENITTIDIREDSPAKIHQDFFDYIPDHPHSSVITNPPFNQAEKIIRRCLNPDTEILRNGGYCIMLLRLNFFGSLKRKPFWDEFSPVAVYVHSNRMSFTEDGKKDSIEYMHCVWAKNHEGQSILDVI